jgi:hypothetical protein
MSKQKGFQFKFVPFATVLIAGAVSFVIYLVLNQAQSFPTLPVGTYTGRMSGTTVNENEFVTIYAERLAGADALLIVVFDEGWQPKVLPIQWNRPNADLREKEAAGIKPIELSKGKLTYVLQGTENAGKFSGEVVAGHGGRGVWSLEPASASSLRQSALPKDTLFNFQAWLTGKGRYRLDLEEEAALDVYIGEKEARLEKLRAYVAEEEELRARSEKRRADLEAKLEGLTEKREQKMLELTSFARELQQLNRITRRGRAIELARRVAKRENKWYLVNWQQGMDLSAVEESLAVKMKVDLRKLNVQSARALEIEKLRNSVLQEQVKVRKLQNLYNERLRGGPRKENKEKDENKNQEKAPWWKRWDTVFG